MPNIDPLHGKIRTDLTSKDPELIRVERIAAEFRSKFLQGEFTSRIHAVGSVVKAKDGTYCLRVFGSSKEGLNSLGEDYKGLKFKKIKEVPPVRLKEKKD